MSGTDGAIRDDPHHEIVPNNPHKKPRHNYNGGKNPDAASILFDDLLSPSSPCHSATCDNKHIQTKAKASSLSKDDTKNEESLSNNESLPGHQTKVPSLSLCNKKSSELAIIPKDALLSLSSPVESASFNNHNIQSGPSSVSEGDPALIPRIDMLKQIINLICPQEDENGSGDKCVPTNARLTLRGMGGLGKTTLAAITVSMTEVRSKFDHIFWLNLGKYFKGNKEGSRRNNLSYEMYIDCLKRLCDDLNVSFETVNCDVFIQPGDSKLAKAAKAIQAMEQAKLEMSRILNGLKILLVLDDVWSHEDVELFNFGESMTSLFSILLTTRTFDWEPSRGSHSFDVGFLNQSEAHYLFSVEAGLHGSMGARDVEAIEVILGKKGYLLPLAVRMAGRYAKTCQTLRPDMSLTQIAHALISVPDSPRNLPVIGILDRSFSFITDETTAFVFKLFFSAFAIVFHSEDNLRPWVSWYAIELLWKALLCDGDIKDIKTSLVKYRISKLAQIADLMRDMGLLDEIYLCKPDDNEKQQYFRINHDLMWEYGKIFSSRLVLVDGNIENMAHMNNIENMENSEVIFRTNSKKWTYMILVQFKTNTQNQEVQNLKAYILDWLPLHMMNSGFLDEAANLLQSEDFLHNCIKTSGIENGTRIIVSFIRSFDKTFLENITELDAKSPMPSVISNVKDFLCSFNSSLQLQDVIKKTEIGRALILLGIQLQRISKFPTSLDYFAEALDVFHSMNFADNSPDVVRVSKYIDSCSLRHIRLVRRDSPNKLRLKYGDILSSTGRDIIGGVSLELISHPGYAIVKMVDKSIRYSYGNASWESGYVGVGLSDSAIMAHYDGQLIRNTTDDYCLYNSMGSLYKGMPCAFRSDIRFEKMDEKNKEFENIFHEGSKYTIDPDGTIYPTLAPNLCLGIAHLPCLYLVACDSPNRAVFKFASDLCNYKRISDEQTESCCTIESIKLKETNGGIKLELSSHPGMGIVSEEFWEHSFLHKGHTCGALFLGPKEDALSLKINEKDHLISTGILNGFVSCAESKDLVSGQFVFLSKNKNEKWRNIFFVNSDGTISPKTAQHLVLGFQVPGKCR